MFEGQTIHDVRQRMGLAWKRRQTLILLFRCPIRLFRQQLATVT